MTETIDLSKAAAPQPIVREAWLDVARGLGIVLVAVGHALGGIIDSPMGRDADPIRQAFFVIYTFHMPLFFILSGLMVQRRIERDRGDFARSLLTDIVWPYFLWSVVQFTLIYSLGAMVNKPIESFWPTIFSIPFRPVSQFWFLYALFILHVFAILARPRLGAVGFLLVCLTLKPLLGVVTMPVVLKLAAMNAPWYGIGVFLAAPGLHQLVTAHAKASRLVVFPLLSVALIYATLAASASFVPTASIVTGKAAEIAGLAWNIAAFPAGLCAALTVVGVATLLKGKLAGVLSLLGRRSMPIFILHVMGIAGTRILLTKVLGTPNVYLMVALSVVVGLTMPLVAFALARRAGINRWLGLGKA